MPTGSLPKEGKDLFEKVYNASKAAGDSPEKAAKKAWGAVKNAGWHKVGESWVKKSDFISELSMTVTAAPFDKLNGEMRWKATASDTDKDLYKDNMSLELYRSFIQNIEKNLPPPEPFRELVTSNFWKGGMPYISLSHYPDLDGEAVPGMPESVYMDGKCLKAKGKFNDTELGRACWKALNKDQAENIPDDRKIRISIGFLDLAHKHGNGPVFVRNSLSDRCKQCADGVGDKTYIKGYLMHLAMTRVPVNPRAEMEVEKSMSKITRKEDAASIVGEEVAAELDEKAMLVGRSEVIVEKAEAEAPVAEAVAETPAEAPGVVDTVSNVEEPAPVQKSDAVEAVAYRPYGGATSMTDAIDTKKAQEESWRVSDLWYMLQSIMENIFSDTEVEDKKKAIGAAVDEFKSFLNTKALIEWKARVDETPLPETDNPNPPEPEGTPIDVELKKLSDVVMQVRSDATMNKEAKLMAIRPAIDELGMAIDKAFTSESSEVVPAPQPVMTPEMVRSIVAETTQPVLDALTQIQASLASVNSPKPPEQKIPKPRSIDPQVMRNLVARVQGEVKPKSVMEICRASVGLEA